MPRRALLLAALLLPTRLALSLPAPARDGRLRLVHTHTGERLDVVYRAGDQYAPQALAQLERFLRDYRTGTVTHLDPRLFDLLSDLTRTAGRPDAEIEIVCGYRTPRTNESLRLSGHAVARHSLHMTGQALDIRVPEVPTSTLRTAALALRRGGVGYYPAEDFLHVDVGRVRQW